MSGPPYLDLEPTLRGGVCAEEMREVYEAAKPLRWWQRRKKNYEWGGLADNLMIQLQCVVHKHYPQKTTVAMHLAVVRENLKMRLALHDCKKKFEFYQKQHHAKNTPDADIKAAVNRDMAEMIGKVLGE